MGGLSLKHGPVPIDDFMEKYRGFDLKTSKDDTDVDGTPAAIFKMNMMRFDSPYRFYMGGRNLGGYPKKHHATIVLLEAEGDKLVGIVAAGDYEKYDPTILRPLSTEIKLYLLPGFDLADVVKRDFSKLLGSSIREQYGKATVDISLVPVSNGLELQVQIWLGGLGE